MSRSELVRKSKQYKLATVICGIGAVCSFIFIHWIVGVFMIFGTGYLFWQTLKAHAASGQRF